MTKRRRTKAQRDADKLQRIALELVAVAPDAPIFLTRLLDTPTRGAVPLTTSASHPERITPWPSQPKPLALP